MSYTQVTSKALRKLFVDVIQEISGLPAGRVLIETKADRRPSEGLYCTLWFKEIVPLVQNDGDFVLDDEGSVGGEGSVTDEGANQNPPIAQILDNESLCTVQINMWGPDAYERLLDVVQAMQNVDRQFDLWRVIGFAGFDAVQDISVQFGARIQQRAYVNMRYYACLGKRYPSDWFDVSKWELHLPNKKKTFEFEIDKRRENTCPHL